MNECSNCGAGLRPGARFCTACGTTIADPQPIAAHEPQAPSQARSSVLTRPAIIAVVVSAVVALASVGTAVFLAVHGSSAPTTTTPAAAQSSSPISTTPPPPPTTPTASPTADAQQQLAQEVEADHPAAEQLLDQWVPQISSKRLGLVVDGTEYDYPAILADFEANRSRFPSSVLVRSDDYTTYGAPGFWVTVFATPFATADEANAWCDANNLTADNCFAHILSHTAGPAGSSKER